MTAARGVLAGEGGKTVVSSERFLAAVGLLYGLRASLAADHRKALPLPDGRLLIPLFHPSPRVMNTRRSQREQLADFQYIRTLVAHL